MRTPATGPENGRPESCVEIDAALIASDVVRVVRVERQDGDDDLDLVAQALDEQGAQRAVDQAAGEDGLGAGATLAAEERAGDLARRRTSAPRRRSSAGRSRTAPSGACRPWWPTAASCRRRGRRRRQPAACLARRPVSKRTVRVPKRPLSMTASANWISGPSTGALLFRRRRRPSASGLRSRPPDSRRTGFRKPLPRTGRERTDAVWWCWWCVVVPCGGPCRARRRTSPDPERVRAGREAFSGAGRAARSGCGSG